MRRPHGGPVRDIVEWVPRRDHRYVKEHLEIDGKTIRGVQEYAVWDVVLSCGHAGTHPAWLEPRRQARSPQEHRAATRWRKSLRWEPMVILMGRRTGGGCTPNTTASGLASIVQAARRL
jgi:hypothetical protein